jgi:CMP-N,N'-diacetyllegionaminic acid synthase
MNILLTICAREGSKRIKDKNLRMIAGKPLFWHTASVAKQWKKAKKMVCSTDSDEIARLAKDHGIEVPFMRPKELASDTSGKVAVIRHALIACEKIFGETYDIIVDLDLTNPFRTAKDLDNCLEIFQKTNADTLFSVTSAHKNPYFNMVEINEKGYAQICKTPKTPLLRTQDAPIVYDINASIYFYKRSFLLEKNHNSLLDTNKASVYPMPWYGVLDIDSEIDFLVSDFLLKNKVMENDRLYG